jgi:hypothetical protein
MFTTVKRHWRLASTLRFVPVIAIAAAAMIAMAPTDARAAANNINTFQCVSGSNAVTIDATGLGNDDLCVIATITQEVDCACAGGGGNCASDTKKQAEAETTTAATRVEADNGNVRTTVTPTVPTPSCTGLDCPSGQRARLIQFSSVGDFRVCSVEQGEACNETTCPPNAALATADNCGPANNIVFAGKNNSCVDLF